MSEEAGNRKPALVALTGGIGSGKSAALRAFAGLGAAVLDCDRVVHGLLEKPEVRERIAADLQVGSIPEGEEGRRWLAATVFRDEHKLGQLETILHPLVGAEIESWYASPETGRAPLAVVEIPLLFEAGMEQMFDATVMITAPGDVRRERHPESASPADFELRSARQLPDEVKRGRCRYVYDNTGTLEELERFVRRTFDSIIGAGRC